VDTLLILISRDDILAMTDEKEKGKVYRLLARLTRQGFHFLSTAPQPDHWSADNTDGDAALLGADSIRGRLSEAGGVLDGLYFVPKSSVTRRRNREQALLDILSRYSITPEKCYLFSSSGKFISAAGSLGIHAVELDDNTGLLSELEKVRKRG
jgi:hypothetical protein